ncbi:Uncharacterized component of anaerobic dehydrogenase-like protein [Denitrovibrio acetiphilus DSM 12809]|jgi:TorA maturation chaperone TorD|uniref:Uncharacterized component of anaerobic dehydrogenase-like protein n=1 Tax=Denitrovibrio acetiphilus (strain DSM 12809 / NBRC 114555 / N2460) TaxID=522772 RepID=D4H4X9_DENA2|nr:molecular chaperone TorD family protein [Denitrovibrio acetiphilus]ADD69335.1 Uncharacterized component of anaerobic dehydrogenase-like protein [Denitrovibrio acetiphilus DSM 12809]
MNSVRKNIHFDLIINVLKDVPSKEFLINIVQSQADNLSSADDKLVNEIADEINCLGVDDAAEKYNEEYLKLFSQPSQFSTIPVASYYLDEKKLLYSDISLRLRDLYADFLFQVLPPYTEDHIVPLLVFMNEIDKSKKDQFMDDYIYSWVPEFLEQVIEATNYKYFSNSAKIIKNII